MRHCTKATEKLGVVVNTFIPELKRHKQVNLHDLKSTLVYMAYSRPASIMQETLSKELVIKA